MSSLAEKLTRHHVEIRRTHLDSIFQQRRILMQTITSDLRPKLSQCLESAKDIYINRREDFEAVRQMALLHAITRNHDCCEVLSQLVPLAPTEIKCCLVSMNLTWLDLLLLMAKENWESLNLIEEVSGVISQSAQQLCLKLKSASEGTTYYEQLKRILEGYPYQLMKEGSLVIIFNTLEVISSIRHTKDGSLAYSMLNKSKPSILKHLNPLSKKEQLMAVRRARQQYLIACLSIASMVHKYQLQRLDPERFEALSHNLQALAWEALKDSQEKRVFTLACSQLILIGKIWNYYPKKEEEFRYFEGFVSREIAEQNQVYFNLLRVYVNFGPHKLLPLHFNQLTAYLFHQKHQYSQNKRISLRVNILSVLKAHIINCGNHILQADLQSFMSLWGEYALSLSDLAEDLYQADRENLSLLFDVLSYVISQAPEAHELVTEGCLFHLVKYAQFRGMLGRLGYELQGECEQQEWIDL